VAFINRGINGEKTDDLNSINARTTRVLRILAQGLGVALGVLGGSSPGGVRGVPTSDASTGPGRAHQCRGADRLEHARSGRSDEAGERRDREEREESRREGDGRWPGGARVQEEEGISPGGGHQERRAWPAPRVRGCGWEDGPLVGRLGLD
jgi:hypothetical protein